MIARADATAVKYFLLGKVTAYDGNDADVVKKLAEIEKCDAEPPSILSHLPKGVSTAS